MDGFALGFADGGPRRDSISDQNAALRAYQRGMRDGKRVGRRASVSDNLSMADAKRKARSAGFRVPLHAREYAYGYHERFHITAPNY